MIYYFQVRHKLSCGPTLIDAPKLPLEMFEVKSETGKELDGFETMGQHFNPRLTQTNMLM